MAPMFTSSSSATNLGVILDSSFPISPTNLLVESLRVCNLSGFSFPSIHFLSSSQRDSFYNINQIASLLVKTPNNLPIQFE